MEKVFVLPEGVEARLEGSRLFIKGPKGETSKEFKSLTTFLEVNGKEIKVITKEKKRKGKRMINTFIAHIKNLVKGVQEGYTAKLKICYGHFPINIKIDGNTMYIENFIGEKVPRKARIMPECEVKVNGDIITITGLNKELVGQTAANIEIATKIKKKDRRIFQDGIWIIKKPGKEGL